MVPLRKAHAGSCNLGYTWPEDGSVVEVTQEHAGLLLAVPDGDFSVAADKPDAEISEAPAPRKAPAKRTAAKKAAASEQAVVEE